MGAGSFRITGATDLHRTTTALDDAARRLSHYFLAQLGINLVFGCVIGIGLFLIGVPSPLLWGGLAVSALHWTSVPLEAAVWGAIAGYLSLWLVYWGFKLLTGKEGMGYGDFKLFAALGAWFGWQALVPIILMASVIGAVVGIALKLGSGLREGGYMPFGPFLAGAGLTAMVFGPQAILRAVGL